MAWKRPDRRRVRAIRDRLREMYGRPVNEPHRPADRRADQDGALPAHQRPQPRPRLRRLRERFPDLGGSARRAGRRRSRRRSAPAASASRRRRGSRRSCERLGDEPDLDWTETAPREESLEFLLALPGVGRKTAACVLIFTWDIPEIPVDVHVHRVGGRLGLFPPKASFERAHDEMLAVVDPADAYELHMNLIRHGRTLCRPKPRCGECELRRMCPWYRSEGSISAAGRRDRPGGPAPDTQ